MPSVTQLVRGTAGFLCPKPGDSWAVSLTLCCSETSETPEVETFLLFHALLHSSVPSF